MNRQLTATELKTLNSTVPTMIPMSRREKLMRFAQIVRQSKQARFYIFHNLEHYHPDKFATMTHPESAFAAAASDSVLRDAGLRGESVADAMAFFNLSQRELHEFSCDCGGEIKNAEMARRIESLAGPAPARVIGGQTVVDSRNWTG